MSRLTEYRQKRYDIMEMLSRLNAKYPDEAKELERRAGKERVKGVFVKWHDLLKNPEDLPGKGKVAFSHVVMTNEGFREYCNTFTGEWFAAGTFELVDKPRAWCEIPKFEE